MARKPKTETCASHKCPDCRYMAFETTAISPDGSRAPVAQQERIAKEWVDRGIIH